MQQDALLVTKLHIPPMWPGLVSRPRLLERLNAGLPKRDGVPRALTLMSAPAGFGKTTLLSEWAHQVGAHGDAPAQVAWLSLDEGDNDPARFLAYLIVALRTIETRQGLVGNIGKGTLSALQSPQPPPVDDILTVLINDIAAIPDRIVLVLDDYHLIEAQPIHDALTFLLEHLPLQMHLVIATREDPPLPLARLRARGQLTEVRARDLRFTSFEAVDFLNQAMGLDLSAEDIAALETRTEGWIAGLQLAAISIQGRKDVSSLIKSFTGSHRFVLDYLIEEVLEQQSESVQTFLLQTAILNRLTASLCDAVRFGRAKSPSTPEGDAVRFGAAEALSTAKADAVRSGGARSPSSSGGTALTIQDTGQATLEMLERANLFIIPLDEERRWYRYHHLFADLLRQRLRQTQPDWAPTLHRRASEWYEQNGFADEAIDHALCAEDFERAGYLIEEHVDTIWQRGEHSKLRRWLAGLPVALILSKPHLCIIHAWDLFTSGQQDAAERCLQAAEKAINTSTDLPTGPPPMQRNPMPDSDRMKIQGRAAAIRAFLAFYRGDAQGIYEYSHQALEHLPEQDLTWRSTATVALGDAYSFSGELAAAYQFRLEALEASKAAGNIYMILIASMKLAVTMRQQGRLERVTEICQQHLQLANDSRLSETVVVGWLLAIWGEVLAELDDLDGAIAQAKKGVELTERGKDLAMIGWSYLCLVRVLFSRGELTGAQEIIQRMENTARDHYVPPWITNLMAAWQGRIWLAQNRLDTASLWAQERGLDAEGEPTYLHEMEYLVLARILIAQGRLDGSARLLQRLLETVENRGHTSRAIEILNLQALAYQAGRDTTQAVTTLGRALVLAGPGGFIRTFVDEGPPMARLLCKVAAGGIASDYARRLLAAFPVAEPDHIDLSETQAAESELVEPLSERELEVLQLVADGLTNGEIASQLFVSLNTVKAHCRNIYGRLGVHSRTQAVAKARALGILPFA